LVSMHDDRNPEPDSPRRSLEILEERMEDLRIPEEPSAAALTAIQPRKKLEGTASHPSHPEQATEHSPSGGHITPPVMFPLKPGTNVADIEIDADTTPVPNKTIDLDEEPTPKPQTKSPGRHLHGSSR